ncbi:MAG: cytochrome c peroxidase [Burkholderiaceae bacterium]
MFAVQGRDGAVHRAYAPARSFGLPPLELPADVVVSPDRVELGRKLFFDRRLSFNGTMSCAMCHVPEQGFTSNASRTGVGIEGKSLTRNAPSLLNVAWQRALFQDGRESSLVTQAWGPLLHLDEMANPSIGMVLDRLRALDDYHGRFERVFEGRGASMNTVGEALAAFEATLVAADSRFDRWLYGGQKDALSAAEQRGYQLFVGKAACVACHTIGPKSALFADGKFNVTGVGFAATPPKTYRVPLAPGIETELTTEDLTPYIQRSAPDIGRFDVSLDQSDRYAFKTPSLRNVAHSAPYMHDGSLASLEDVVDFYNRGGGDLPGKSALLKPLGLDGEEKAQLVAFLRALDGSGLAELVNTIRPARGVIERR